MKKVTANTTAFKVNQVTTEDQVYVGFDVHKRSYAAAIWCNGAIVRTTTMPADIEKVLKFLEPMRAAIKKVVYEAGPTGYGLARALESSGYNSGVAAPSKTPGSKDDKSDRLDCRQLAAYAAKGMLRYVSVPTHDQELDRQVRRLREQLSFKLKRIKQQIKGVLLQYGIGEPDGLTRWSTKAIAALKALELDKRLKYVLDRLIDELEYLNGQIAQVEGKIAEVFGSKEHAAVIAALDEHKGIDILTASHLVAELHNPKRFSNPRQVARYLGLSPRVRQSGITRREGPICKTGRRTLRANLIEASWVWVRYDPYAKRLFYKLIRATGNTNKAITAIARRLAIRLWRLMCAVG
jgi:transposase